MKYILPFFLLTVAASAYAVSTCETRVDSHQKASTKQRVEYCLMQEPTPTPPAGPELVYTGTYSVEPADQQPVKSTVKDGYFRDDKMSVQHQYVGSRNFPKFTNDTLSEQERAELTRAYLRELDQQHQAANSAVVKEVMTERAPARLSDNTAHVQPQEIPVASLLKEQQTVTTTQGMKKRQQKPQRFMKEEPVEQEPVATTQEAVQPQQTVQPAETVSSTAGAPAASNDPLFSAANGDDDLLNDELGLEDEPVAAPIPGPADKK